VSFGGAAIAALMDVQPLRTAELARSIFTPRVT
jgi:hypothetical protein